MHKQTILKYAHALYTYTQQDYTKPLYAQEYTSFLCKKAYFEAYPNAIMPLCSYHEKLTN